MEIALIDPRGRPILNKVRADAPSSPHGRTLTVPPLSDPGRFGVLLTVHSIDGKLVSAASGLVPTSRPPEPTQQCSRIIRNATV